MKTIGGIIAECRSGVLRSISPPSLRLGLKVYVPTITLDVAEKQSGLIYVALSATGLPGVSDRRFAARARP
ncbi:hypothetical protein, partial [Citrobacter koseri]|uniref:hypothetical protein n=1 Tax=Citrobacter koseri TaxID=545 RepID=UPI0023B0457B